MMILMLWQLRFLLEEPRHPPHPGVPLEVEVEVEVEVEEGGRNPGQSSYHQQERK
jgi:hypothetical protein